MAGVNVRTIESSQLWEIVFIDRCSQQDKEVARKELRRRGLMGEPIVEQRKED